MDQTNPSNDFVKPLATKISVKLDFHSAVVEKCLIVSLWFCASIMFLIQLCGIFKIFNGIYVMFYQSLKFPKVKESLLSDILNGLELIFVSPLIYLLVLSLLKYINVVKPRSESDLNKKSRYLNNALLEIMTVKLLSVALFISILVLRSIDLVFNDEMSPHLILYIAVLLVILIVYYYVLDLLAENIKKHLKAE